MHPRYLTDLPGRQISPSLHPDGQQFVYVDTEFGHSDLNFQSLGGKPQNLTADFPAGATQPAYSPNGQEIAFRSNHEGGGIFIMPASGGVPQKLSDQGYRPAWSPKGSRIV